MVIVPRDELARQAWDGFPERGGGARRVAARAAVARLLWDEGGERRVPPAAALDRAVSALSRGDLERMCELNPFGPVYFIPTPPFLRALARRIRSRGARRVLEVAAGDGHLTRALSAHAPPSTGSSRTSCSPAGFRQGRCSDASCARRTATSSRSAPGAESRATSPAGATSTSSATSSTRSAAAASTSSPRASCTRA